MWFSNNRITQMLWVRQTELMSEGTHFLALHWSLKMRVQQPCKQKGMRSPKWCGCMNMAIYHYIGNLLSRITWSTGLFPKSGIRFNLFEDYGFEFMIDITFFFMIFWFIDIIIGLCIWRWRRHYSIIVVMDECGSICRGWIKTIAVGFIVAHCLWLVLSNCITYRWERWDERRPLSSCWSSPCALSVTSNWLAHVSVVVAMVFFYVHVWFC